MANTHHHTPIRDWSGCTKCRLHHTRKNVVVSKQLIVHCPNKSFTTETGIHTIVPLPPENVDQAWKWLYTRHGYKVNNPPHLIIIGEAPGDTEDFKGIPFFGISGRILNTIFLYAKSSFLATVTNTVCCRPVHTKETTPDISKHGRNREPEKSEQELCLDHTLELFGSYKFHGVILVGKVAEKYHNQFLTHNLPVLSLKHPAFISRMDYKLYTIKEEARKLELWLRSLRR